MNENWSRWINASIVDHFITQCQTLSFKGFTEGQHRDQLVDEADLFEIRIDGPYFKRRSKLEWRIYVEVNILVQSVLSETDLYKLQRLYGKVVTAFTDISIYKYGTAVGDDSSLIGCLQLNAEEIKISNLGQIAVGVKLQHATVEAHYVLDLLEE